MFSASIESIIKDNMHLAVAKKQLTAEQLAMIYEQGWFNLWVPKVYGGLEYDLKSGCQLLEELAFQDGGLGWTVTLCSGANMFAGFLEPQLAESVFQAHDVCWGGSGKAAGRADITEGGYVISGLWKYATGAPHLTHFTLNAWLYKEGQPILSDEGEPVYASFFVDCADVLIHYDWDTFGLEVTASHSFSVEGLFVPANRSFNLIPEQRTINTALYYYPFMAFAACTLVVNYMGMFRKFVALYEKLLYQKSADTVWNTRKGKGYFKELDIILTTFETHSEELYTLMTETWGKESPDAISLERISELAKEVVLFIREKTTELFPRTGIDGAQRDNEINMVFRNIFTATQHALLNG
ncbi:acyl-CoA dehydrogenase [Sphingobacterium psychroaquaticum]|uniref:acyl-CoA dehydrogenase family protein n=1 Tax=Sphingobacterium psychroaquaticum TaxID=561061 RepID=UPI00106C2A21|nr:acyl-CoA dehydrogenase family protein [Sphingobacterium psychroaquaticum]QBQ41801.1 acyl-CoA dehydrogenase [Sphingobacterium psychroaquaticum]